MFGSSFSLIVMAAVACRVKTVQPPACLPTGRAHRNLASREGDMKATGFVAKRKANNVTLLPATARGCEAGSPSGCLDVSVAYDQSSTRSERKRTK